jgi:hypothetical protein
MKGEAMSAFRRLFVSISLPGIVLLLISTAAFAQIPPGVSQAFASASMPQQVSTLIKSGGMAGPLEPVSSSYTTAGNLSMMSALSAWNHHDWTTGVERLKSHIRDYPNDPWTPEAMLHVGSYYFYTKDYASAEQYFGGVMTSYPNTALSSKSLKWLAMTYLREGRVEDSKQAFIQVDKTTTSWSDRTQARNWLLEISRMKSELLETGKFAECGRESLKVIFEVLGDKENVERIGGEKITTFSGLTMAEIQTMSHKYGRPCWGVRVESKDVASLACPFIAHYGEHHFVAVRSISDGNVAFYDPFAGEKTASLADFAKAFTGDCLVFAEPKADSAEVLDGSQMASIRGGCCPWFPLPDSGECPVGDEDTRCCCEPTTHTQHRCNCH